MYKFSSQRLVRFVSDDDPVGARHGSLDGGMMFVPVINSVYNRPQWTPHFIQAIGADIYGANWLGAAEGPRGMQVCMAVRMGHRGKHCHKPGLGIAPVKQSLHEQRSHAQEPLHVCVGDDVTYELAAHKARKHMGAVERHAGNVQVPIMLFLEGGDDQWDARASGGHVLGNDQVHEPNAVHSHLPCKFDVRQCCVKG